MKLYTLQQVKNNYDGTQSLCGILTSYIKLLVAFAMTCKTAHRLTGQWMKQMQASALEELKHDRLRDAELVRLLANGRAFAARLAAVHARRCPRCAAGRLRARRRRELRALEEGQPLVGPAVDDLELRAEGEVEGGGEGAGVHPTARLRGPRAKTVWGDPWLGSEGVWGAGASLAGT